MDDNSLHFGIELELLLGSLKKSHSTWKSLAKDVSKRLTKAGIANHINDTNDKSASNYREWSIAPEVTIPSQPAASLFGLELVSPVYPVTDASWATDLGTIFATLHHYFSIHPSPNCSTHVHISGSPRPLSALGVAALAKAALYYETALDMLVPANRRGSAAYWCQSNRASPALRGLGSLAACLEGLDRATTTRQVVEAVNLFPANSAYGRAHGKHKDFVRGKVYKWDFTGMLSGGRGTVEFRQPAGSVDAQEAAAWVTLAATFVAGSIAVASSLGGDVGEGGSREELWAMLVSGGQMLGWDNLGGVEDLFRRGG